MMVILFSHCLLHWMITTGRTCHLSFRNRILTFRDDRFLRDRLASTTTALFVAECPQVVGMVAVGLHDSPDLPVFKPQKRASISDIYVSPEQRREGLARSLIITAEQWARDNGASAMDLTVYEFNESARKFFEEMGYSTFTRRMAKDNL